MKTKKAYESLTDVVDLLSHENRDELEEVASMALETLYEKAKDYDNMLIVAMDQQVAREESDVLTF